MSGSRREDYLLREARGIAAIVARIVGLRMSGNIEEARGELEKAYGLLLGSDADLARRVDSATAASLLGDTERIRAFAQLVEEEAAQADDEARAKRLKSRVEELGIEIERRVRGDIDPME